MTLPITIQMQIDLTAAAHKREVAEGFAMLREKLLPKPSAKDPMTQFCELFASSDTLMWEIQNQWMLAAAFPLQRNPLQPDPSPWHGLWGSAPGERFF